MCQLQTYSLGPLQNHWTIEINFFFPDLILISVFPVFPVPMVFSWSSHRLLTVVSASFLRMPCFSPRNLSAAPSTEVIEIYVMFSEVEGYFDFALLRLVRVIKIVKSLRMCPGRCCMFRFKPALDGMLICFVWGHCGPGCVWVCVFLIRFWSIVFFGGGWQGGMVVGRLKTCDLESLCKTRGFNTLLDRSVSFCCWFLLWL